MEIKGLIEDGGDSVLNNRGLLDNAVPGNFGEGVDHSLGLVSDDVFDFYYFNSEIQILTMQLDKATGLVVQGQVSKLDAGLDGGRVLFQLECIALLLILQNDSDWRLNNPGLYYALEAHVNAVQGLVLQFQLLEQFDVHNLALEFLLGASELNLPPELIPEWVLLFQILGS